jgi:hypothetical protein
MMSHFKQMDQMQLSKLQMLEKQFGDKRIIAYENKPMFAEMTPSQLESLKMTEKELGATLVVYGEK